MNVVWLVRVKGLHTAGVTQSEFSTVQNAAVEHSDGNGELLGPFYAFAVDSFDMHKNIYTYDADDVQLMEINHTAILCLSLCVCVWAFCARTQVSKGLCKPHQLN